MPSQTFPNVLAAAGEETELLAVPGQPLPALQQGDIIVRHALVAEAWSILRGLQAQSQCLAWGTRAGSGG